MTTREVAIIGAGPAGIAAAIQLLRSDVSPLLFGGGEPGGLLWNAYRVENYPGFPSGIAGPRLARRLLRHLHTVAGDVRSERVELLSIEDDFRLTTGDGAHAARTVIIASGTRPRPFPDVPIDPDACGAVHRDVWALRTLRGRQIAIVGGGDAAFDYALTLARRNAVTILVRGEETCCLPLLERRAVEHPRIRILAGCWLSSVCRGGSGLRLTIEGEGPERLDADALVVAIGREPDLSFVGEDVERNRSELVETGRLHFVGDVDRGAFRQTSIAVGDGVSAAMKICARLRGRDDADR